MVQDALSRVEPPEAHRTIGATGVVPEGAPVAMDKSSVRQQGGLRRKGPAADPAGEGIGAEIRRGGGRPQRR
eukprot:2094857-Lingulodinium_polyedra.AAC.1